MSKLERLGMPPEKNSKSGASFKSDGFSNLRPPVFITADQRGIRIPNYLRRLHLVKGNGRNKGSDGGGISSSPRK